MAFPWPSISLCFSILSSSLDTEFHLYFFFTIDVSAPIGRPLTYSLLGEFPGLGLALVPDVMVPVAEQGCARSRNLVSNICSGRGLNLVPCSMIAATLPIGYGALPSS